MYIHERKNWPDFFWDQSQLTDLLAEVRYLQGRLLGRMESLGFRLREEASLRTLMQDVIKTSEIEGEKLDTEQVRSSIAKRLGMNHLSMSSVDRNVEGIVEVMFDATRNFKSALTKDRLFAWHTALFPMDKTSLRQITVGRWRTKSSGTMQVLSGPIGREKIHFEAPKYNRLNKEMANFISWFNAPAEHDLLIKSALAHFWFVTIHPFDDGNGRIARAIADMMLARSENSDQRFYSMSMQIQKERKSYYDILETCQKGSLDITIWLLWFLNCLKHAITAAESTLQTVLTKARFWTIHTNELFNERQRQIINLLLDGFYGKLTSSKWAKITKCSQDTALRDISDLLDRQILIKDAAGGRSTNYQLQLD